MLNELNELKAQIERDLQVATSPEDNAYHLQGLSAVESLIGYVTGEMEMN
jgi:hypothetical protein